MNVIASSKKLSLAIWLLVCPTLLAAAVLVLPRYNLDNSPVDQPTLFVLLVSPFAGVIGIIRHTQFTPLARLLAATGYLTVGRVSALNAILSIICSWSGACL